MHKTIELHSRKYTAFAALSVAAGLALAAMLAGPGEERRLVATALAVASAVCAPAVLVASVAGRCGLHEFSRRHSQVVMAAMSVAAPMGLLASLAVAAAHSLSL
jgi:hypothetical protein